jgi:L-amino acid N-acyltransferase
MSDALSTESATASAAEPSSSGRRPQIRRAERHDAEAMRSIYNYEVENHTTTLDMVSRSLDDQIAWIDARSGAFSAIIAELPSADQRHTVVGFASMSPFRDRPAYSTTVENSVYVSRAHAGLGIGRALMEHLIVRARDSGFHSMIARIESSGEASLALHRACGFELVGVEREVGRKHRRWLDMTVMQLMLSDSGG